MVGNILVAVTFDRKDDVAFVEMDNPPVNAIGLAVRKGLQAAIDWVATQENLTHVVFSGKGRAFAAGGDAREFDDAPQAPHLPDLVSQIEAGTVPWIAAISGTALGGGCELALACRLRIAKPGVMIGLPEVSLGVVPGAGGTARLPRLIGMKAAVGLISTGRPVSVEEAKNLGLIDIVAEDPIAAAIEISAEQLNHAKRICDLPGPTLDSDAILQARNLATRKMRNQIAPQAAIDLVANTAEVSLMDAFKQERKMFLDLRTKPQARALRHVFFAERAAKTPDWMTASPGNLDRVAIIGGGTMGAGIAYALLNAGLEVTVLETDPDAVKNAGANIDKIIGASLGRGLIDENQATGQRSRLRISADYGQAAGASMAIEAAFESMEVKSAVFSKLAKTLNASAILATNTSYLDIDEIAATVPNPERVLGLHFFAPAHIMKLLEIVRGKVTSDTALATGYGLAKRLRKVPVLSGVCDGFIGNRILARYREAADTLLLEGAYPWEIDEAMVQFGYAMGPYETQDLSGLDIGYANRRRKDLTRDPERPYVKIGDLVVEAGRLGRKTGAGWYRYDDSGAKTKDRSVESLIVKEAKAAGVTRRHVTSDEIRRTLVLAMINEAADILHEGIAQTARDIDLVTIFGYGFPRWRGGLMHYADTLDIKMIAQDIDNKSVIDPASWRLSPVLRSCLENGTAISDLRSVGHSI